MRPVTVLLLCLLVAVGPAVGQEPAGELTPDEIVERILRLRRELDALMEALPAELRGEVERRLAEVEREPVVDSPIVEASAPAEAAASMPAPAEESQCAALAVFDSNDDGFVSGLDRYWRFFKLWLDDGDGDIEEPEVASLYDSGIAQLSARLRSLTTVDGGSGDVWIEDGFVLLDVPGKHGRTAVLLIDADRLARGGELRLVDVDGTALTGLQSLGEAIAIASAGGEPRPLLCP